MMLLLHAAEGSLCNRDYQDFSPVALSEISFARYSVKGSKCLSVSSGPLFHISLNSSVSFSGREAALKSLFWLEFLLLLLCLSVSRLESIPHISIGLMIHVFHQNQAMMCWVSGLWEFLWNAVPIHLSALSQLWASWCWLNNWIFPTHTCNLTSLTSNESLTPSRLF